MAARVRLAFLDSHPKEAGFFGREGLRITEVSRFDAAQLEVYRERTGRSDVWRPVALLDYSPDRAQVYSEDCFRWYDLPLPDWTGRYLRHVAPAGELLGRDGVRWFGHVIQAGRGARVEHEGGGTHDAYTCRAVSVAAAPDTTSNVVAVFGFLDPSTRRLCGHIAFPG